jgi:hypothetical protein
MQRFVTDDVIATDNNAHNNLDNNFDNNVENDHSLFERNLSRDFCYGQGEIVFVFCKIIENEERYAANPPEMS